MTIQESGPAVPAVRTIQAKPPSPRLAAAYCRVSTDYDCQEGSLEAQTAHWEAYIAAQEGWTLAGIYAEAGLSATQAETRPALMRLMDDCAAGKVNLVLTKSISRFSRNTADCLRLVRTLKALGVGVVFEKENIDTGAMTSELFLTLLASFAAEESRSLSQNVKMGYTHRFRTGTYKYTRPPYGYDVENGELVIHEKESVVVEEIFDSILAGMSLGDIAAALEARGVQTKYNAGWTRHTVMTIAANLTYTGDSLLQKTYRDESYRNCANTGQRDQFYWPDHHPALVSREAFILANKKLGFTDPYERIRAAGAEEIARQEAEEAAEGAGEKRVTVIKAKPREALVQTGRLRVAAYCRVSTDMAEQEASYEAQCSHYHALITGKSNWSLAGIYADEGISGTSRCRREGFNRMIQDAEDGKIDLILTKSISRFARNTLDCLSVVRRMRDLGVGITFEKEGIDTLDGAGEVIMTILASIAQQESASLSQNVRLGIQYRFQQGKPMVNCSRLLGYDKDKQGRLTVNETQAAVVRRVFRDYLDGLSMDHIARALRREGVSSGAGRASWPESTVRYMLGNEKYAGDLLLQKTVVVDFLTRKTVWNRGQLPQYYVENAHPPIVPKAVFLRVRDERALRAASPGLGGEKCGSRRTLSGRTCCPRCGKRMLRRQRAESVFRCACGATVREAALKAQVLAAWQRLPGQYAEIRAAIEALGEDLESEDTLTRARARRQEWRLKNLLPPEGPMDWTPECRDEQDFRARTARALSGWDDDFLCRVVEKVAALEYVVFRGGVTVYADEEE